MEFRKITEESSPYRHLEKMSVKEIVAAMNREDMGVAVAVEKSLPQIENLIESVVRKMKTGGRLFYIGAGTSGRLGILDASECPPTFGVSPDLVVGIIAGGKRAVTNAVEKAEDDEKQGWNDLQEHRVSPADFVMGIATSGTTPYVAGALKKCRENGITTGSFSCNPHAPVSRLADFPVETIVGPEFITGSTRLKGGTATKMVLNMISTTAMIRMGRVKGNQMVDMQLTNTKIIERGTRMLMEQGHLSKDEAQQTLLKYKGVRKALDHLK